MRLIADADTALQTIEDRQMTFELKKISTLILSIGWLKNLFTEVTGKNGTMQCLQCCH